MKDLISRSALLKVLNKNSIFQKVTNSEGKNVIEIVNEQPIFNDGWIPCSERLPQHGSNILVCQRDGYVNVGYYSRNKFKDMNSFPYEDAIAWRELPQPYQPKGE